MRKFATLVPLSAVLLAAGACQSGDASDDASTAPAEAPVSAVEESPLPELDPAMPATPVFALPADMAENPEIPFPYLLAYEHQTWSYDIAVEGLGEEDRVFVTSYLLPEDAEFPDYDSRLGFIAEYDALVENGAHEASHSAALINGSDGVFRFSIIRDGGPTLYQRNFFIFAQNHIVQITCQWTDNREIVSPYCGEMQETFTLE